MNKERNRRLDYIKGIAIIAVVLYHLGILKSGYLGVDIFFVINGFLLVPKMLEDVASDNFQYVPFLRKRMSRIYPLIVLVSLVCLFAGMFTMLPDDLENLSESVVASLACSNNILSWITTNSYWDMSNELKPLMHLWYVGILVEFYILFPIILIAIKKWSMHLKVNLKKILLYSVILLWGVSVFVFVFPFANSSLKFYFLPFRLFELLSGGLSSMCLKDVVKKHINNKVKKRLYIAVNILIFSLLLCGLLTTDFSRLGNEVVAIGSNTQMQTLILPNSILVLATVVATCLFLLVGCSESEKDRMGCRILCIIGMASYSIFIWHQPIVAFYRYTISCTMNLKVLLFYCSILFIISYLSYRFFETTNYRKGGKVFVIALTVPLFIGALTIYNNAGVIKDIPELNVSVLNAYRGMNAEYVDRIYNYNNEFSNSDKKRVLLIGNSYARDWGNILLESEIADGIEISYVDNLDSSYCGRIKNSDYVFVFSLKSELPDYFWDSVGSSNAVVFGIGTKNFGRTMGQIYIKRFLEDYYCATVELDKSYADLNQQMKSEWQNNYVDILQIVKTEKGRIKVFTDDNKYISPDGYHLTQSGAQYFSKHINIAGLFAN